MLVLSRRVGESIVLGDDVVVTVTRVAGNRVAIGVEAPSNVRVLRGELESQEQPTRRQLELQSQF